ncbi:hypothetical protein O0235_05075 [Tepidiforma flava]|uniref:Flp pilus-assembly TadG-like N-terminal domain-containing protein n=1 Tax=Tepidiforma flava TaxID=3004094 RepID=A0ABY7M8P7_9CHLR|nr:hypothetical protein [Tepidiforma flava]WBL36937.1 hypothetical protein O0235_05075 [Tepidiforma flava]
MSRAGDIPLEPPVVRGAGAAPAKEDRTYLGYVAAALAGALLGGFALAADVLRAARNEGRNLAAIEAAALGPNRQPQ